MKSIAFIDTEVSTEDNKSYDFGAIDNSGKQLHTGVPHEFFSFIENKDFICGHNIVDHDAKHTVIPEKAKLIDTLYLSPLLFPNRPYHALLKDDKLLTEELNNPLNDSQKAMDLFYDEVNAFNELDDELKQIYYMLLKDEPHFSGFWSYVGFSAKDDLETLILIHFDGKICENAPISDFIRNSPVELSYCLALISATERYSLIPRWVQMNYPKVDNIIRRLRNTHCHNCAYCNEALDPHRYLRKYFGYTDFRKYNGEPLQENAVDCAIEHEALLAIFPTGGCKSLTFQIPALISGETERGLTVVISPLQSLMKDQVDTLEKKGIEGAVTINGLLSPIERAEAIERVESGLASILYISPESLRSVTIERLLLSRHIDRFVIDEAHCFSAWGQDFRVDYLYIGDFIKELQEKKGANCRIPVSCFTATAKQKVVSDIKDYFRNKLGIELNLFTTDASRTNLRYAVLYKENDNDKYEALRDLIETKKCPTIIYVSRTRRTYEIAKKLCSDGFKARPYNGKMESSEKQENQEAFINDEIQIIVATSACKKCGEDVSTTDIEKTLLFLSKISSVKLEGGFLVLYSGMRLKRLVMDNKIRYKNEDYKQLNEFYKQKIQQIHIVGEYANMMVRSYEAALKFVNDYFQMDYKKFLSVYFKGERATEIERNITPEKYRQLFDTLSERQLEIIKDDTSQYIVCTAGPGSGKTRVLVHKLASLLLLEDVKHEQLLMLTFSRAAALEFKNRLRELIGNAAYFIEVKTFHSYCFDLLGKIGNIKDSENVVRDAGALIRSDDIDLGKVTKTVLVIDEAQDMDTNEFSLVEALMERNDELRVIAVGDDDQNIYQFRGSDSKYLRKLITDYNAKQYDLVENYRSSRSIVNFANCFVKEITERLKTADISAVTNQNGEVRFVKHTGSYIENALIDDVISTYDGGTTCVLTNTNDETLVVLGILKQCGVEAKLIQSIGSLDIYNIAELRYFIKKLQLTDDTAVISNEQWDNAVYELQTAYSDSTCLPLMLDILNTFKENNKKLYRSDFEIFLHESRLEDFYKAEQGVITISTMHRSKGREFDNVYVLLNKPDIASDENKRKLYVAFTRAKSKLCVHYSGTAFDKYKDCATDFSVDEKEYSRPTDITLQLSYKDVYLDFFKDKKQLILKLKSGTELEVEGRRLYCNYCGKKYPVAQFSRDCSNRIQSITQKGYSIKSARIRYIVAWKGENDERETAIILPDVDLKLG